MLLLSKARNKGNILKRKLDIRNNGSREKIKRFRTVIKSLYLKLVIVLTANLLFITVAKGFTVGTETNQIKIVCEVDPDEIFPVLCKFASDMEKGIIEWTITNKTSIPMTLTVTTELQDWCPPSIDWVTIDAYETKKVEQTPISPKLMRNHEVISCPLLFEVKKGNEILWQRTKSVRIRATGDMIFTYSTPLDLAPLIAAWVTPRDPEVERILARAKEKLYSRTLNGYQYYDQTKDAKGQASRTKEQARAIFNAVRDEGISYISSTISFGKEKVAQRVRFPRESIRQKSANCIDGAVLFASLFENIGMEPIIYLLPRHAFVGVRLWPGSKQKLFIETTLVGRSVLESLLDLETTFDAAVMEGTKEFVFKFDKIQAKIDIKACREWGIYPLW